MASTEISFGQFTLFPARQILLDAGRPVPLGGRAFLLLMALVERAGQLVDKKTLIAAVWPDTVVEECNLRSHVAALRRALGCGKNGQRYITTVAGRGYRFVAPTSSSDLNFRSAAPVRGPLPARITSLVGRDEEIDAIEQELRLRRLVTLVGPGGIGKTTVAMAVAQASADSFPEGITLLDIPPTLAASEFEAFVAVRLGIHSDAKEIVSEIVSVLRKSRMLLLIDGCEHVLEVAASLCEFILREAADVRLLVTSREQLGAEGEYTLRLDGLPVPKDDEQSPPSTLRDYPAVELFLERAQSAVSLNEPTEIDLKTVSQICRKLEGNPLAIELGAGQVATFGLRGLSDLLNDGFILQMQGRRTALPRHRSLYDTLEWSYRLLPEDERRVLRLLAIFVGRLTLDRCSAVFGPPSVGLDVPRLIASLVAKSLISAEIGSAGPRFRLLDATRAFALERLHEAGEHSAAAALHARCILAELATDDCEHDTLAENLSIALDWAHSSEGDLALALQLTLAAIPYWFSVAQLDVCRIRIEQILRVDCKIGERELMTLLAARAGVLMNRDGAGHELVSASRQVLTIAESLSDQEFRLRAYWGLWVDRHNSGMHFDALKYAADFHSAARALDDPAFVAAGDRMMGISLHYTGDLAGALVHLNRVLERFYSPERSARNIPYQYDQRVAALCYKARVLWLMGSPERAMKIATEAVTEADAIGHVPSLAYALCEGGCPLAMATGQLEMAKDFVQRLHLGAKRHGLELWQALARCFEGWLHIQRGEEVGFRLLRAAVAELRAVRYGPLHTLACGKLADGLRRNGAIDEALRVADDALERSERRGELWCSPELMRIKAEILAAQESTASQQAAITLLQRARDTARSQGAASLELRIAISSVRNGQPMADLVTAYERFRDGFWTDDLRAARDLLDPTRMAPLRAPGAELRQSA